MRPLSVGIIGFGRIGAEHAGWLRRAGESGGLDEISVAAIADATAARRALAESRGLKTCDTASALFADPAIDAVLISTPTAMHYEQALAALTAGKHVMIEKPMAIDLAQSQRLVDEAGRHGLVLSVFHNRRWDRDYLTVKSAIDAGVFGRIINIESRIGQWASCVGPAAREYRPGWRNEAAFGGGGLFDWGSHLIDQLWRLLAPARPLRVFAQLRGNVWSSDCDDFARVLIDFDNGAVGLVEINTTTTYPLPRWHIDGTAGSADSPHSDVSDINTWSQLRFKPAPAGQVEYRSTGAGMVAAGETGKTESTLLPVAQAGLSEVEIWRRFARAIRGQGEPAVTPASVLGTMALLDAARQSSRTGQSVDVSDVAWM